ncbi:MAG: hypothetical protein KF770_24355 [Anaerolineae bacterium]|nr:hypothetical protein [Anaerolineae bacterium]
MKHYQILTISYHLERISLHSTDVEVLNWIEAEIKEIFPKHIKNRKNKIGEGFMPSGERYALSVGDLAGYSDFSFSFIWWIIKQLCEQGWKPSNTDFSEYKFQLVREFDE